MRYFDSASNLYFREFSAVHVGRDVVVASDCSRVEIHNHYHQYQLNLSVSASFCFAHSHLTSLNLALGDALCCNPSVGWFILSPGPHMT